MKQIYPCIIIFLFICTSCANNKIMVKDSNKYIIHQNGKYWCWAASLESIYRYKNLAYDQTEIMKNYSKLSDDEIKLYRDKIDLGIGFKAFEMIYLTKGFQEIAITHINDYINKDIPVMMLNESHVSIIVGSSQLKYFIAEPGLGKITSVKIEDIKFLQDRELYPDTNDQSKFYTFKDN